MNWYHIIKKSMPLPNVTNEYPPNRPSAVGVLDNRITQETKEKLDREHSREFLDYGGFGVAYNIGPKIVEKITTDSREYKNALDLIELQKTNGGPLEYVVYIYSLDQVQSENNVYRLILEKVQGLSERQRDLFDLYFGRFYDSFNMVDIFNKVKDSMPYLEEEINFLSKILDFIRLLRKNNVSPSDVRGWNVGLRGSDIVILDIGAGGIIKY